MADQKFKSKVKLEGGVNIPSQTASTVPVINGSNDLVSSSVTSTELGYMSGVTSSIQTQLGTKASLSYVNAPSTGVLYVAKNGLDTNVGGELSPFLTIGAAITAATSGTTIFIMPGTYSENVTLAAGVSLQGQQARTVIINGNMTAAFSGTVHLHSLDLQASSGVVLTQSGSSSTNLQVHDCHIDSLSGASHGISYTNTNSASKLDFETGAITVAVSTSAKCFSSSGTAAGSVIFNYISSRLLDNKDNICLSIAGSLAFSYTLDDVHGQIVVANTASFTGINLNCETTTAAILTTNSSSISSMANISALSGANPCFTGAGLFAHGLIGFPSTGEGFAATLNAGAGAAPIPTSSFQFHPEANTTAPYDGQVNYTGTHLYVTIGATRYQLDRQVTGTNTGDQIALTVPNTPSGNLVATNVQDALNELQTDVDSRILTTAKGNANGVASLDGGGKIPVAQLPSSVMTFEGVWNASSNSPTLADGTGDAGMVYRVGTAGTQNLGSGSQVFAVGDWVVYNGTIWQQSDNSDAVMSVFGRTGVVTSTNGDYTASQVTNVPAGTIAAITVQAAINELDGDAQAGISAAGTAQTTINNHISNGTGAHAASAIGVTPSGNLSSTNVQAALVELQLNIDGFTVGSAGDITEASFSITNNQSAAANITGLAFSNSVVRSFKVLMSIQVDATVDLWEAVELIGINKGGVFDMAQSGAGDTTGVVLSITSGGQVQYTCSNYTGFVSGAIKFRAITTSV